MRIFDRKTRPRAEEEAAPLDPVAVTLAIWLTLVVGVTGFVRLAQNAPAHPIDMSRLQPLTATEFPPFGL